MVVGATIGVDDRLVISWPHGVNGRMDHHVYQLESPVGQVFTVTPNRERFAPSVRSVAVSKRHVVRSGNRNTHAFTSAKIQV